MNNLAMNPSAQRRQQGISLLTIALLLLMIGGALLAGVAYFRAHLPSELASSQKEALSWADKALIGYASVHHRLPCPAAAPDGDENCTLSKGWLPAKALDLDATMFAPGTLPMRYMVYRQETAVSGEAFRGDLTGHDTAEKDVPANSFEPVQWDDDSGQYSGRYGFKARNGLDMCETMRLAYNEIKKEGSAAYAHFKRENDGKTVNVAYGIAIAGAGDASGSNNTFEGANASGAPEMEAPDRQHGSNYNDYVFVRDVASLMSLFSCQPVPFDYTFTGTHLVVSSGPSTDESLACEDIQENNVGEENVSLEMSRTDYPMQISVESVAMAVDAIAEVNSQFDEVKENAESAVVSGGIQSSLAGVGTLLALIGAKSNVAGLANAIAAIAGSLGTHAGAWLASAQYAIAIAVVATSLALNASAVALLIKGTIKAGKVKAVMNGGSATLDLSTICGAMSDTAEELKNNINATEKKRDEIEADIKNITLSIKTIQDHAKECRENLGEEQYSACSYEQAISREVLKDKREKEEKYGELKDELKNLKPAPRALEMEKDNLDKWEEDYRKTLGESGNLSECRIDLLAEKARKEREANITAQHNEIENRLDELNANENTPGSVAHARKEWVDAKSRYNSIINTISGYDPASPCIGLLPSCTNARDGITQQLPFFFDEWIDVDEIPYFLYDFHWIKLHSLNKEKEQTEKYLKALRANLEKVEAEVTEINKEDGCSSGEITVAAFEIWKVDGAEDVLKEVDARGVLQ